MIWVNMGYWRWLYLMILKLLYLIMDNNSNYFEACLLLSFLYSRVLHLSISSYLCPWFNHVCFKVKYFKLDISLLFFLSTDMNKNGDIVLLSNKQICCYQFYMLNLSILWFLDNIYCHYLFGRYLAKEEIKHD